LATGAAGDGSAIPNAANLSLAVMTKLRISDGYPKAQNQVIVKR
jgi:hypothetical protein